MVKIIVGRNGKDTVRSIAEDLPSVDVFAKYYKRNGDTYWKKNWRRSSQPTRSDVQINWAYAGSSTADIVYNKGGQIALSSDKMAARQTLKEASVPIPWTYQLSEVIHQEVTFPLICRERKHQAGSNLIVAENYDDLFWAIRKGSDYFSVKYDKKKEFRVHVAHGKVLVLQEKVPLQEEFRASTIWNHAGGEFVFETVRWDDYDIDVCKVAVIAVKELGLDFGAVDVLYNDEASYKAVVCEVNTSPSLADYSLGRYKKYFKWLLRSDTRREWYNYEEWTRGKSYAFKNYQLEE